MGDSYFGDEFEQTMKRWGAEIAREQEVRRIVSQKEKSPKTVVKKKAQVQLPNWISKQVRKKKEAEKPLTPQPSVWIRNEQEEQKKKQIALPENNTSQKNESKTGKKKRKKKRQKLKSAIQQAMVSFANKVATKKDTKTNKPKQKQKKKKDAKKTPWVHIIYTPMGNKR